MAAGNFSPRETGVSGTIGWLSLFVVLLLVQGWLITRNFSSGFLPGHEFRQTQTALSILFILRDGNFNLAYPTPLFGPPWSIPMEFPLYQWTVATVVNFTGWTIPVAGRAVNLACFYLTLPGLYLLVRELRWARPARWILLCLTLTAPIYIFYTRSVLIESMALLFSVWFLTCFLCMCNRHNPWALLGVAICGTLAILVKVTTFVPWCLASAAIGLAWCWRQWRDHGAGRGLRTVLCGLLAAAPPGLAITWWLHRADAIKALSPGGRELTSGKLTATNFGTLANRLDTEAWTSVLGYINHGLLPWWFLPLLVVLAARRGGRAPLRPAAVAIALFGLTLLLFPLLYQRHDYYLYAIGPLLLAAVALVIHHLARHWRRPAAARGLLLVLIATQLFSFGRHFAPLQNVESNGGSGLTNLLRATLSPDAVLVIAGQDWTSALPYYSERRALMLRDQVANDPITRAAYLRRLDGQPVAGLLLTGDQRGNRGLVDDLAREFDINPRRAISFGDTDAYFAAPARFAVIDALQKTSHYVDVEIEGKLPPPPSPEPFVNDGRLHPLRPVQAQQIFRFVTPRPTTYRSQFGFQVVDLPDGSQALGAHPDAEFRIPVAPNQTELTYVFGIQPAAFEGTESSDGVSFAVRVIDATGTALLERTHSLRPTGGPEDATPKSRTLALPSEATTVIFLTRHLDTYTRDWAYWSRIELQ